MSKSQLAVLVTFVLLMALGVFAVVRIWQTTNDSAYMSCLASEADVIVKNPDAVKIMNESDNWRILSESEVHLVTRNIRGGDCGAGDDPELDPMGRPIHVALRREVKGRWPPIVVWSNGRDGVERTDDDVVMPYGQEIPK